MKKPWVLILLLCIAAALCFIVSNYYLKGYLRSEVYLAKELKTPLDSLDQNKLSQESPFRYRPLFTSLVKGGYELIYDEPDQTGYFQVYQTLSFLFYLGSVVAMFALLNGCGFTLIQSFSGALIFLMLPAMIMAYTLPVHTREDTLGYTLFFLGLLCMVRSKRWLFLLISLLGVFTRETLLLLPLLYLFFAKDEDILRRLTISLVPAGVWIMIRVIMGATPYDRWEGLRWNLDNPEQVVGFLFITFNVLWLPYIVHLSFYNRNLEYTPQDLRFFYRSSIFTLIVILVTTFFGGIFNEIRLLNLFAPWMIVIFLNFIRSHWLIIAQLFKTKQYRLYLIGVLALCTITLYLLIVYREKVIPVGKYNVPYDLWIFLSIIYIFIFLGMLPPSLKVFSLRSTVK